jgi:hypothetical protein
MRERVRRYLSGIDLDEPLPVDEPPLVRLPAPLPRALSRLASAQLFALGALVLVVGVALAVGGVAIVLMPFALGRRGVGMSMVSMFFLSLTAMFTTLPLFALRGAARILRRDARGLAPLHRVAWLTIILSAPLGVAGALGIDTLRDNGGASTGLSPQSILFLAVLAFYVLMAVWTVIVLGRYRRTLPSHVLAAI